MMGRGWGDREKAVLGEGAGGGGFFDVGIAGGGGGSYAQQTPKPRLVL